MAVKVEDHQISLSVRDLVQPSVRQSLLSSFPLPQRGMLGQQAHSKLQQQKSRRFGLFHSEYSVHKEISYNNYQFHISGRIDGVYRLKNSAEIEEIKSVILTPAEFKKLRIEHYPEFIEQVQLYGYLLQEELNGLEVKTYLVMLNLINEARKLFPLAYNRQAVEQLLLRRLQNIIQTIESERRQQQQRSASIQRVSFALAEERPQQKLMMERVAECLSEQKHLLVSAPTGTGKTAAALFPAIQYALAHNKKIFFATSKTTQQNIVDQTMRPLIEEGLDMKVVFLRATEKMCANEVYFCHQAYCPYARDYRERMLGCNIIEDLLEESVLRPERIRELAEAAVLCPFEVSLDLALHADMVVADYNYVFDPAVFLRRLFFKKDLSDWILILDEAHNLYDRGMDYLSPSLWRQRITSLQQHTASRPQKVFNKLAEALKAMDKLFDDLQLEGESYYAGQQYFQLELNEKAWEENFAVYEAAHLKYLIHKVKKRLLIPDDPLENFYFALRRFVQVSKLKDRAFVPFYDADEGGILKIQCCDPSGYLGQRIDQFHTVLAMSATLDPMSFYEEVLGFPEYRTERLQLDSPFPAAHRKIVIVPDISTRYKDRAQNYPKIAEVIERVISLRGGNYLVFFPSFDFVQNVNLFLGRVACDKIIQKPGMSEEDRDRILQSLRSHQDPQLLLGVMGGIFSEGVDFSGDMAIGVIIVSPALPMISFERELLRRYYEEKHNLGMEYAYIFPGMNKVIQSVGRLIRSATDKGVVVLIGERFGYEQYHSILPEYWFKNGGDVTITSDFEPVIKDFWRHV